MIDIGLLTMNVVKSIVRVSIQSSTTNSSGARSGADDKVEYANHFTGTWCKTIFIFIESMHNLI